MNAEPEAYLIYAGAGFLANIPARNLTRQEAEEYGEEMLLKSGLYTRANPVKAKPSANKVASSPSEDKEN